MIIGDILNYIPHRNPMILIDRLVSVDELSCVSEFKIPIQHLFVEGSNENERGILSEMGLIEHVAQGAMAFIQYYFQTQSQVATEFEHPTYFGYISNIISLEILENAFSNDLLITNTQVELAFNSENLKICHIESLVKIQDNPIFKTKMKMVLQTKV